MAKPILPAKSSRQRKENVMASKLTKAVKVKACRWSDGWHAYPPTFSQGEDAMLVPAAEYERLTKRRNRKARNAK